MTKIDWVSKLTSRKFWMAVIGFVTGLLTYLGMGAEQAEKIGSLILMAASIAAYIMGEGLADAAGAHAFVDIGPEEAKPPEDPMEDDGK
ncbi:MAG: hypothetical protein IKI84_03100 [Clostridia bacterium]|nr:hypothetical protein [Clostridia bacterium]